MSEKWRIHWKANPMVMSKHAQCTFRMMIEGKHQSDQRMPFYLRRACDGIVHPIQNIDIIIAYNVLTVISSQHHRQPKGWSRIKDNMIEMIQKNQQRI
jgi:hypothetical protein